MKCLMFLLTFFCATDAFANHILVSRNLNLSPGEDGYFQAQLHFDETRPGRVSQTPVENGCSLHIRSRGNFFLAGRYKENLSEEKAPTGNSPFWVRRSAHWSAGQDLWVSCVSGERISDSYIRRVMAGYAGIGP